MSDVLVWTISAVVVLFWLVPVLLGIWVVWQVVRRLRGGEEAGG